MQENITLEERIKQSVKSCEYQFWAQVAADFPEIKHGDFPPIHALALEIALTEAISNWYRINKTT